MPIQTQEERVNGRNEKRERNQKPQSHFHTCTAAMNFSCNYLKELYVRMQMYKSVGPGVEKTRKYKDGVKSD